MNNNSKGDISHICLLCKVELPDWDSEAGFAVCGSCRGYYYPEKHIYYRRDDEHGPEVVIISKRQAPRRLARPNDIATWVTRG